MGILDNFEAYMEKQEEMSENTGTVLYVCPSCGKQNRIKYNDKLVCNSCIYGEKK